MAEPEAQSPPAPETEQQSAAEPEQQPEQQQQQTETEEKETTSEQQQQEVGEPQPQQAEGEKEQAPPQEEAKGEEEKPSEPEPVQKEEEQEDASAKPAEEQEGAGDKGEGEGEGKGEGKGEGEGEKKEEEPEPEEEPIVISPEGSPHWLSTEDVLAKGIPQGEVENFKSFHLRRAHHLQAWYESLKEHTFVTEFLTLTSDEVDVLLIAAHPGQAEGPELSEEQKDVIAKLEERIGNAIELFGEDGASICINTKNAEDAMSERNDAHFVAKVRDDIINELEVQKQFATAYSIWLEQQHHEGIIRRGIKSIRRSFRRSRGDSASRSREAKTKLQEEDKKEGEGEQTDAAEGKAEGGKTEEGEQPPPQQEGEGEPASQTRTVEVTVEGDQAAAAEPKTEDKPQQDEAAPSGPPAEPQPEQQTEPPKEEPPKEEPPKEEPPKEEPKEESKEEPKEVEEQKKEGEEGEKKEGEGEGEKKEGEEEIQKSEEDAKKKPTSPQKKSEPHLSRRAKAEPLDNKVLRAFGKIMSENCRVTNGKEAVALLLGSVKVKQELTQFKAFGAVEGLQVVVSIRHWHANVPRHSGMLFRGFVYKNELNALSQFDDTTYYPDVVDYKSTIQHKVYDFFNEHLREVFKEFENYIIDFFVSPEKVYIVRLNPFHTNVGACLFTWNENAKVLTRGPFEFRVVEEPKKAPECFSSFQSDWQTMLESVLQSRKEERRQAARTKCVIL